MSQFNWESFLKEASKDAAADYRNEMSTNPEGYWRAINDDLPDGFPESEWLGFPPTTETQIANAEDRLGIMLPLSYRTFLKVTNGWPPTRGTFRLRPIEEVNWFCVENQDWIDEWMSCDDLLSPISDEEYLVYRQDGSKSGYQPLRTEYMQTALQISDVQDGDVVVLNPQIMHEGEWEAWILSNALPGANRYRSFFDMIQRLGMTGPWM